MSRWKPDRLALGAAGALFLAVLIGTAWLGDDSMITMRTVANALAGHGLVWNLGERVQTFTHPLWMLLMLGATALTHDLYRAAMGSCVLSSVAAVALAARYLAPGARGAALLLVALSSSRAFMDYSTSGLENPLSHLLLVLALILHTRAPDSDRKVAGLAWLLGLAITTRHDNLLLFAPLLLHALWRRRTLRAVGLAALGATPFLLWTLFSVWYYGFPFPNTAYAKLGTAIPLVEKVQQGGWYGVWTLRFDPATILLMLGGPVLARRDRGAWPAIAGAMAYLAYVVSIGGDFMGGRFFSAIALVGAVLLARALDLSRWSGRLVGGLLVLTGLYGGWGAPLTVGGGDEKKAGVLQLRGIVDERRWYSPRFGLTDGTASAFGKEPMGTAYQWKSPDVDTVDMDFTIGASGLFAPPGTWILDSVALSDPLLARLPMLVRKQWRPGHFGRVVPLGYPETLISGENRLRDADLAEWYDHLCVLTRGDLGAPGRLSEILAFNLGRYDHLIDRDAYAHPSPVDLNAADLRDRAGEDPDLGWFSAGGANIHLERPRRGETLQLTLRAAHTYEVQLARGGKALGPEIEVEGEEGKQGLALRELAVPEEAADGFDEIQLRPSWKDTDFQERVTFVAVRRKGEAP